MKIRFAIVAAVIAAAASACSSSPTSVDPRTPRTGAVVRDQATPPDTTSRGGGTLGSGT
jgi:hypothetical protein